MALQDLTNYVALPSHSLFTATTSLSPMLLDAAGEKAGFVFLAPKTGSIRKIGFRTTSVITGSTVDVRLETVDAATGDPSGTLVATNTNVSQVIADADDNVWFFVTLTADAPVTYLDKIAIVIAPSGGNMNISGGLGATYTNQFPYATLYTGSWTKQQFSLLSFYIEYDDGSTASVGNAPTNTQAASSFNTSSSPDERALYFQVPFRAKVAGVDLMVNTWVGNADIVLYDSDGTTALATISGIDKDLSRGGTAGIMRQLFSAPVTIEANTAYRLALKPTSTSNAGWYEITFPNTTVMAVLDGGANFHLSTRADAGSWSQTTTTRPSVALLFSAFEDGAGSGGVYTRSAQGIGL